MPKLAEEEIIFTLRVIPKKEFKNSFLDWTTQLNTVVASFVGFISLDISVASDNDNEWIITQRFLDRNNLNQWRGSEEYQKLIQELEHIANKEDVKEIFSSSSQIDASVTEVIVTHVNPGKEKEFREWMAKIHQIEAKFPGFKGAYVQSPSPGQECNWITLLQFDTAAHLDQWLSSPERGKVVEESKEFVSSLERHRVISPYAGWFASLSKEGEAPPAWKQAMIVLLFLFPIVMLEIQFLKPQLTSLNPSLGTFIGNTLSVALLTWVMMPIGIKCLGWWLSPESSRKIKYTIIGTAIIAIIYLIEIAIFWQ